jgi:ribosomal protein S1
VATKSTTTASSNKSHKASSMAELMASSAGKNLQPLKKGDTVQGTVKKLSPQEILLDIGAKGDALVLEYDKKNLENLLSILKVGDTVNAQVLSPESEEGFPVVSLRRTLDNTIFSGLEKSYAANETVTVEILDDTRGGYFAATSEGTRGFLPNSQIISEEDLVGKHIGIKIIEFDRARKRVIFSEKATHYTVSPEDLVKLFPKDMTLKAKVTSVTPYGVYATVTSKDGKTAEGFIHISEISYDRVNNIDELYKKGDEVQVQVVDVDKENRRVNISVKKLEKDSFDDVKEQYKVEQKVTGTVTDVKSRGVTLALTDTVKGFIPVAKIPSQTPYKVGDTVEAEVSDFDSKRRLVIVSPVLKAKPIGYR